MAPDVTFVEFAAVAPVLVALPTVICKRSLMAVQFVAAVMKNLELAVDVIGPTS